MSAEQEKEDMLHRNHQSYLLPRTRY